VVQAVQDLQELQGALVLHLQQLQVTDLMGLAVVVEHLLELLTTPREEVVMQLTTQYILIQSLDRVMGHLAVVALQLQVTKMVVLAIMVAVIQVELVIRIQMLLWQLFTHMPHTVLQQDVHLV
jgi:hypothetical protein